MAQTPRAQADSRMTTATMLQSSRQLLPRAQKRMAVSCASLPKDQTRQKKTENLRLQEHFAQWSEFYKPVLKEFSQFYFNRYWHDKMSAAALKSGQDLIDVAEAALFLKFNSIKYSLPL